MNFFLFLDDLENLLVFLIKAGENFLLLTRFETNLLVLLGPKKGPRFKSDFYLLEKELKNEI
jgi:hypothetical protein